MKFELTRDTLKMLVAVSPFDQMGIARNSAHEAQKELVKWGNKPCEEHVGGWLRRRVCSACSEALLKHFGVKDEENK